jgi:hypothetical protein
MPTFTLTTSTRRLRMTAPAPRTGTADLAGVRYEPLEVWPDEIKIGDIYGGYVVAGIHSADHYREPAVRLTIYTDPEMLHPGYKPEEIGRFVLVIDRDRGHRVPIERPRRR